MEMTYDGALIMPSNYAILDEDEMAYIEGGLSWDNAKTIAVGILAVVGACNTVMAAFNNAVKWGSLVKGISEAAFVSGVASKVSATIGKITAWISQFAGIVVGVLATLVAFAGGYYVGQKIGQAVFSRYKG